MFDFLLEVDLRAGRGTGPSEASGLKRLGARMRPGMDQLHYPPKQHSVGRRCNRRSLGSNVLDMEVSLSIREDDLGRRDPVLLV